MLSPGYTNRYITLIEVEEFMRLDKHIMS